jgi:RimJ/RimL family protein N-acetyltransferase
MTPMGFSPGELTPIADGRASDGVIALGWFGARDAAALCACDADAEHRKRFELAADHVPSIAHALAVIRAWEQGYRQGSRSVIALRLLSGECVGGCEARPRDDRAVSLGYWVCPAHRGRGYCKRGVQLVCAWLATLERFDTLEVLVDADNLPSRHVAAACGFEQVGTRDGRLLHVKRLR